MPAVTIPDNQWLGIYEFLRAHRRSYAGKEANCRRFVEGALWIARSGAQWRLLPETYGSWNSVYKRFARWCDNKVWEQLNQHFVDDPDMEHLLVDSTVVRAHPCAAGALKVGVWSNGRPIAMRDTAEVASPFRHSSLDARREIIARHLLFLLRSF